MHALLIQVCTYMGSYGSVGLTQDGSGFVVSHPQSNARDFTSLAGLSYPRNS